MQKRHKKIVTEVDLLLPIPIENLKILMTDTDCFGKEWEPQNNDCSICASNVICGILFQDSLKAREKELNKKQGPYLDEVTLDMDWEKLKKVVVKFEKSGNPMLVKELFDYVKKKTKSKDKVLIIMMIKKFIKGDSSLYTSNKQIRYRDGN